MHLPGGDVTTTPSPTPDARDLYMGERGGWSLVWLAVLTGGINVWGFWWSSPFVVVLAALMIIGGLAGTAACWFTTSPRSRLFQRLAFVAVMVTVVFPQAIEIHTRKFYTTDAAAFDHVAARALLHGSDPYAVSMAPAARLLQMPDIFWTYTVNGGHVSQFSYPAGSFLLDFPAFALGFRHAVVDWVDLIAWLVSGVLLFVLLPTSLRWLAALVTLTPALLGSFSSGETDAIFVPFLILAVWRWDRFGQGPGAGLSRWVGPIALGLACAIKQTPWFCVPLLVTGVFLEARMAGRPAPRLALRYLLIVLAVFGAVNLPFVVWQPSAWVHGTLTPLVGGLVADGQGLVSLATHGITGGADLIMLSVAGGLALVTVVTAFALWYPHLKRIWLLLLPIPLFFSPRSLSSYLVDLFPAAVVAALSVHGVTQGAWAHRRHAQDERARPFGWKGVEVVPVLTVGVPALGGGDRLCPGLHRTTVAADGAQCGPVARGPGGRCRHGLGTQSNRICRHTPFHGQHRGQSPRVLDALGPWTCGPGCTRNANVDALSARPHSCSPERRPVARGGVHRRSGLAEHLASPGVHGIGSASLNRRRPTPT